MTMTSDATFFNDEHDNDSLTAPAPVLFQVGMTMQEVERQMLLRTLEHFNNHKPNAARALGISLKTVYNRLAKFDSSGNEQATAA